MRILCIVNFYFFFNENLNFINENQQTHFIWMYDWCRRNFETFCQKIFFHHRKFCKKFNLLGSQWNINITRVFPKKTFKISFQTSHLLVLTFSQCSPSSKFLFKILKAFKTKIVTEVMSRVTSKMQIEWKFISWNANT